MVSKIKLKSKRTKAQTPAPKKDQIVGSKKNPKGSAGGSRGKIEVSEKIEKTLKNKKDEHNDKYTAKSKRVDLGMLKAVYRRGAGAFSVSHRPKVTSRDQWALARVNAFLKLVGTGERKKAYNTDLDLLPNGHPQKSDKKSELSEVSMLAPKKYSHIDFKPPQGAVTAAKRALKRRAEKPPSQRGMTAVGIARARDLANGKTLSPDTVKRMLAYFTRHEVDKKGSTWDEYGKGRQAWDGWGGDAGFAFARKVVKQMKSVDEKNQKLRAYGEAIQVNALNEYDVPEGLTIGKTFKTLSLGQVSSRMSGDAIGKEISVDLLNELVRVFNERKVNDPVIIDWQHATSPFQGKSPAPPESGIALGMIIDLEVKDDGLYAVPAYNEEGLKVVEKSGGILWSSPEYIHGEIFTRDGGDKVGDAQLLAITLTPRPAQSHNKIDRITLSEDLMEEQVKELQAKLAAKDELVKELEEKLKEMKDEQDATMNAENDEAEKKTELEDDSEKKAEKEDEKKMKEEDEKDHNKMSENFRQDVALLNEVQALRESVKNLEAENTRIKCDEAVSSLLREGKISVAEKDVASKAWNIRELQPEFWNMFSERPVNSSVPLDEVGHGASGQEISKGTLDQKVRALAEEKKIGYSDALSLFREQQPDFYRQAFGG
jgi:phage I-like protein